jgi:hypothetical protein
VDKDGTFTVAEIWESQEQRDGGFDENVKPNVPGIALEVIQVRGVHRP